MASGTQIIARAALLALAWLSAGLIEPPRHAAAAEAPSGVAILQVDTDRHIGTIDRKIYGQFLEHINHSVVDGLFAEQIRGAGFEGKDFETYWTSFGPPGAVRVVEVPFERGAKSVRLIASRQPAGIRQERFALESGRSYDGSVWIKIESGAPRMSLRVRGERRKRAGGSSAPDARIGVAGSAVRVREPAHRSRRGGRDWRRRTRRGARRLRLADARRRAQKRHAASRSGRGSAWTRARVHPLARRLVRLDLQVAGRRRAARVPRLPSQRNMGRLFRLLRLRHRRVPGADPSAGRRSVDRAAGAGRHAGSRSSTR